MMALDQELFPVPQHYEPESQDPSPSLIRRLAYAISSLKQRVKWAICLLFLRDLFNSIRRKPMSKDVISAEGEESMKEYIELAISSMKNVETVR